MILIWSCARCVYVYTDTESVLQKLVKLMGEKFYHKQSILFIVVGSARLFAGIFKPLEFHFKFVFEGLL